LEARGQFQGQREFLLDHAVAARFRRHAFGWKSQPAITRVREALSEVTQVARLEPLLAAEGAIALLERISPALEHVDSSSGSIGSVVNRTIAELVPVIAHAPADGVWDAVRTRIRALFDDPSARSGFVASVIGKEVGLD
jgi:hypothetical protein